MKTAARLALSAWRNDDVYEFALRVRGLDLSGLALAMQVRLLPDTPGEPQIALAKVDNGNAQGLRVAGVATVDGVVETDLRIRINKSTLQGLPYAGELGDASPLHFALLIAGRTRLYGELVVLAHAYGSDAAPSNRPAGLGLLGVAPVRGATLTIAADDAATLVIDGADLLGPLVTEAMTARDEAAASATALAMTTEQAADTLAALADASGRYAWRARGDGSLEVPKLRDGRGRLVFPMIDAQALMIDAINAQLALAPPLKRQRLKRALYDGRPRQVMATDPVTVTLGVINAPPTIPNGVAIDKFSERVRHLGGKRVLGTGFPADLFTYGVPLTYGQNGDRTSNASGLEFIAPATAFELFLLDAHAGAVMSVEIDGVATNAAGYSLGPGNTGNGQYIRVDLPGSAIGKRIRLWSTDLPYGGLVLPAGSVLADPTPSLPSTAVFVGDSITEGSGATRVWRRWVDQAAERLGLDDWINIGRGSSGYLAARPGENNFRQHIGDVLTAVNGGPPDLVVIAGGINDTDAAADGAEALLYFEALRAAEPDMVIIVLGPFWGDGAYPQSKLDKRDAIFASAAQVRRVHTVDIAAWYAMPERPTWFEGDANGPHPIDTGHAAYGRLAADAIAAIIERF